MPTKIVLAPAIHCGQCKATILCNLAFGHARPAAGPRIHLVRAAGGQRHHLIGMARQSGLGSGAAGLAFAQIRFLVRLLGFVAHVSLRLGSGIDNGQAAHLLRKIQSTTSWSTSAA